MNEPQIQELFTPLDELPGQDMGFAFGNQPYDQPTWHAPRQSKPHPYACDLFCQALPAHSAWQLDQLPTSANAPTAPPSPDCLPLESIGLDTLSLQNGAPTSKGDSDELIGMGLYDSPAEIQSSSLLFGGYPASGRKALKLEESFEPTEQDVEEGEEDGEGEDEEVAPECQSNPDEDTLDTLGNCESQSIANHLSFGAPPQADSLAAEYLATLRQLNSAYYPAGYNTCGWL